MLTINKCIPGGRGLAPVLVRRATTIELDWEQRRALRFTATDSTGQLLDVDLPPGRVVRGGDVLVAGDGSLRRVIAAPQPLLRVSRCAEHGSPSDLLRVAYLLGRQQQPLQLQATWLQVVPHPRLAEWMHGMHLTIEAVTEPFEPELGEDAAVPTRAAGPEHDPEPVAAQPPRGRSVGIAVRPAPAPHVHGPGCRHEH